MTWSSASLPISSTPPSTGPPNSPPETPATPPEPAASGALPASPHLLAARHLVFGTTNLLVISLPPGWHIREGIGAPEIDSRSLHAGRAWATACQAHYVLWGPAPAPDQAPPRLELNLNLTPAVPGQPGPDSPPFVHIDTEGETELGSHPARYSLGVIKHGLFGRERRHALWVTAHCEETERWLSLTARAPLRRQAIGPDHLGAVLTRLPEARCH